ncbi:lysozyme inhibitor LprI family protein [Atopomonas sediminilitoris]|uniref:lysozyme inhibitor LprI family protein n=1 Tax=Atopomonas sediminilitoris TaxID=2919919 RepID=UPI001F4D47AA|nr:lysozyme inhibitor LprI family protein [Atopomonas sediminilitoris]MCJ8170109.1 DUF1311 domain-containing protein [Atopomonas sediminilitoris]
MSPRLALLALFIIGLPAAHAGALEDCYQQNATRPLVSQCLTQRLKQAEQAHLAFVQAAVAEARSLDGVTDDRYRAAQHFAAAEKAFNQYRQSQCDYQRAMFASGTGADQAALACLIDLTEAHTERLRRR